MSLLSKKKLMVANYELKMLTEEFKISTETLMHQLHVRIRALSAPFQFKLSIKILVQFIFSLRPIQ